MKLRFKSEEAMDKFASISIGYSNHNKNMAKRYGMNEINVIPDELGEWWDTPDGDFTINVSQEGCYFDIIEK